VADLRRDLTCLSPVLERRRIARSRFRTTHRSGSIWLNGSGREWNLIIYGCHPSYSFRVTTMSALGQKRTLQHLRSMSALPPTSGHQKLACVAQHLRQLGDFRRDPPSFIAHTRLSLRTVVLSDKVRD